MNRQENVPAENNMPLEPVNAWSAADFDRSHLTVARELPGCLLQWDGCSGIIVETESYAVEGDAACHTAFRPSAVKFFAAHPPGTTYVYLNYGIHWMLNVLAADGIILFRALFPLRGINRMQERRGRDRRKDLCSGPGKLGQALALNGDDHGSSLLSGRRRILRLTPQLRGELVCRRGHTEADWANTIAITGTRIGIRRDVDKPWRFLLPHCPWVSASPRK